MPPATARQATGADEHRDRQRYGFGEPDDQGDHDPEPGRRDQDRHHDRRGDRADQHLRGALRFQHDELDVVVRDQPDIEDEAANPVGPSGRHARGGAGWRSGTRERVVCRRGQGAPRFVGSTSGSCNVRAMCVAARERD